MGGDPLCGGLNSIQISKGELRLLGFRFPFGDAMGGESGVDLEKWKEERCEEEEVKVKVKVVIDF